MPTLSALWRSTHPGPTLVVTALAGVLGVATGLDAVRLVLLVAAVFAGQVSIGLSNDAIDARRDASVGRRDKPIAAGVVSVRLAWAVAAGAVAVALGLSAPLGLGMLGIHAVTLASAWSYNAGLKATALSVAPFLVSFGLFPSLATLSAPEPTFAAGWAWIAGAALGAAVHLTNVLPDLDDDAATGIRGLPHRIGARASAIAATAGLLAGAVAVLLGPAAGDPSRVPLLGWVFFALAAATALATLVRSLVRRPDRTVFRLVMLTALLLAAQLAATGRALAG
jgi:4-hydroxybenzoate polyprenyltransferase